MYEGNPVDLQMEKVISADAIFDDTTRACKVDHYDTEEDFIYLEVRKILRQRFCWMQNTDVIFQRGQSCCAVPVL